jgi:hypothetical protein
MAKAEGHRMSTNKLRAIRTCVAVLLSIWIASCAAVGPRDSPDFAVLVAKGIPDADGKLRFTGAGEWLPNTRGFNDIRSTLLSQPTNPVSGVLAVTDAAIFFLQWEESKARYEPVKRIRCSEIVGIELDSFGLNRRIVIQKSDLSFEAFNVTNPGNITVSAVLTEKAVVEARLACKK